MGDASKAAIIGAIGAVLAALVTALLTSTGDDDPAPPQRISITSWTQEPATRHGSTTYEFEGTFADAPEEASVRVIVRNPTAAQQTGSGQSQKPDAWLVSPAAEMLRDGHWKVTWTVGHAPRKARWTAVLVDDNAVGAARPTCDTRCQTPPPTPSLKSDGAYFYGVVGSASTAKVTRSSP